MTTSASKEEFAHSIAGNELLIHKVCRLYGKTDEDRKDLFQEIIIQAWQGFDKFRGESKFSTWLYRVAINTAISGIRKSKRSVTLVEMNMTQEVADSGPPPEEEQLQRLYAAIDKMNPVEKALIGLYLEEKSYEEMEAILGINQGALRVKMTRVREKLRTLLNQ